MVKDENGNVKQGSLTKLCQKAKESRMWKL